MSSAYKLNSPFAISEDFPVCVRLARRKLLEFARSKGLPFRLRHDKLLMDDKCFIFDTVQSLVREKKQASTPLPFLAAPPSGSVDQSQTQL